MTYVSLVPEPETITAYLSGGPRHGERLTLPKGTRDVFVPIPPAPFALDFGDAMPNAGKYHQATRGSDYGAMDRLTEGGEHWFDWIGPVMQIGAPS